MHSTLRTAAIVSLLVSAGCARTTTATDDDRTRAHARCAKDPEYQADESAKAEKAFAAHCAKNACAGKEWIAALCIYRKPSGGSPLAEIESTIAQGDTESEEAACHTVRASGAVASFFPLDVYCKGGKRCMACGTK